MIRQCFAAPNDSGSPSTLTAPAPPGLSAPNQPPAQPSAPTPPAPGGPTAPAPAVPKTEKPAKIEKGSAAERMMLRFLDPNAPKEPAQAEPKPQKKPAKPQVADKPPETPPSPEDASVVPAKPKAPAKPKPAPKPELTPEQIAEAAGEGVARVLADRLPPVQKKTEPVDPTVALSLKQQKTFGVLQRMEKINPEYKGVAQRFSESIRKLKEYAAKWELEHPGEAFDEDAPEHQGFFAQNDVDWSDEDYMEALTDLKADEKLAKAQQETNRELSEIKRKEELRESTDKILAVQHNAAQEYWKLMGEGYDTLYNEQGGVDGAKFAELEKKDRIGHAMRVQSAQNLHIEAAELYKVMRGLEPFAEQPPQPGDPDYDHAMVRYQVHQNVSRFATEQERYLMSRPAQERVDDQGRSFLTAAEYYKLPAEKRSRHWTFTHEDFIRLRAKWWAENTKKTVQREAEKYRQWAEDHGLMVPSAAPKPATPQTDNGRIALDSGDDKPVSPSAVPQSKMAAAKTVASATPPSSLSAFVRRGL